MLRLSAALLCVLLLAGCAPEQTSEIDLATDTAEDADYTSSDLLAISDELIASIQANGFHHLYAAANNGQKPVMILARAMENNTDEQVHGELSRTPTMCSFSLSQTPVSHSNSSPHTMASVAVAASDARPVAESRNCR